MKIFTCQDMGGVCATLIKGETPREIALRAMEHYREVDDADHRAVYARIKALTPEEQTFWRAEFQVQFDAAPTVASE